MSEDTAIDPRADAAHHRVIKGRSWRVSDPAIPATLESELVHELMDARRAVSAAQRASDDDAVRQARDRVQDAKVALGERGGRWWERMSREELAERLRASMLTLLRHRAPESTICPSDAARVTGGVEWRDLMPLAREVAFELQAERIVDVRAKGERVAGIEHASGPLRIARAAGFMSSTAE